MRTPLRPTPASSHAGNAIANGEPCSAAHITTIKRSVRLRSPNRARFRRALASVSQSSPPCARRSHADRLRNRRCKVETKRVQEVERCANKRTMDGGNEVSIGALGVRCRGVVRQSEHRIRIRRHNRRHAVHDVAEHEHENAGANHNALPRRRIGAQLFSIRGRPLNARSRWPACATILSTMLFLFDNFIIYTR